MFDLDLTIKMLAGQAEKCVCVCVCVCVVCVCVCVCVCSVCVCVCVLCSVCVCVCVSSLLCTLYAGVRGLSSSCPDREFEVSGTLGSH